MAKLTDDDKLKILADWKAGISQNQLSKNYSLSPATINKIAMLRPGRYVYLGLLC